MIFLQLFLTFFKIGLFTFGGGYAMIPVVEAEVVPNWLDSQTFMNFIAVAESTPGPIAINMATFIGSTQGACFGVWGSVLGAFLATLGVVLPSVIVILLIATLINGLMRYAGVKAFLLGIRPVVCGLIVATGLGMVLSVFTGIETIVDKINFDYKAVIVFGLVVSIHLVYKRITKKTISPILLIIISAILGLILYGIVP